VRFYLDEHIPHEKVPGYLRHKRHGCQHATDLGYASRDDAFHYQYARSAKRILITRDEDFADPRRYPYRKHPGVIIIAVSRSADADALVDVLDKVLRLFRTAASLYESKVVAPATYCVHLTEQGQQEKPYPP
jgi:predicted nuclease of predicted toxin-antitoxin system